MRTKRILKHSQLEELALNLPCWKIAETRRLS